MKMLGTILLEEQQALSLITLLALSLVLPLFTDALVRKNGKTGRRWRMTVWCGQLLMALSGLIVIVWPAHALAALLFAAIECAMFALILQRQFQVIAPES